MSRFPISGGLQDDADAVCVPDYRSRASGFPSAIFHKSSISSERLEYHPGENSLSLRGRSLKRRPGVDRRRKVMSIIMPCRSVSRLSISIGQGSGYSPPQLNPHLGGSGGLRAAAISDPMRQNTPDVVRTAPLTARIALPASPPIKSPGLAVGWWPKPAYGDFENRRHGKRSNAALFPSSPLSPQSPFYPGGWFYSM